MSTKKKESMPAILKETFLRNQSNGPTLFVGIEGNGSSVSGIICEMIESPISTQVRVVSFRYGMVPGACFVAGWQLRAATR